MFYANEAMMISLWKNVDSIKCPGSTSGMDQIACITSGREVLQMLSMEEVNKFNFFSQSHNNAYI